MLLEASLLAILWFSFSFYFWEKKGVNRQILSEYEKQKLRMNAPKKFLLKKIEWNIQKVHDSYLL